ncbi:MAG: hypothetical protein Q4A17_11520, partial [Thermoguttaceae bacterium]|nr:hypothetical protein [Thermoguttaceae bacterium]
MSTFSVFRKNQKLWLAVLGVLTMLSFVFIPTLEQCSGRFVPGNQAYFKTREFGDLSYGQFELERQKQSSIYQVFQQNFYGLTNQMVASTWLKAKYAEKFGFVVSDYEIRDFISKSFESADDYKKALDQFGMNSSTFEEGLKEIILAQKYETYCLSGLLAPRTIQQQWELFCTIYRNANINVIPVRAEDFLTKVSNPSKLQLKKFFEEHKSELPNKNFGIVGFKIPAKMRIHYLVYKKPVIEGTPAAEAVPLPENINLEEAAPEAAP